MKPPPGLPGGSESAARRRGQWLVALQFLLIAGLLTLAAGGWAEASGLRRAAAIGLGLAGLGLMAAAVGAQRLGNFRIHPEPQAGGRLVRGGPYRWLRHPMYSAVLLCGMAALLLAGPGLLAAALLVALAGVLQQKAVMEEAWMARVHPEYPAFARARGRLLPRLRKR